MALPKLKWVAPDIRAAITSLQTNLPGQIVLFNAEGNVQLATPANAAYYFGGNDPIEANGFPAVEVAAMEGITGNFSIDRVEFDHDPKVNVVVWQEGDNGEVPAMYERALGYTRVVLEVLAPDAAWGAEVEISNDRGFFWRTNVIPVDPTLDPREFQVWRMPLFMQFTLQKVERFS